MAASPVPIDLGEVRRAVDAITPRVVALVRSIPDGSAPTRGMRWTVAQTAAHMVTGFQEWTEYATGRAMPADDVAKVAAVNEERLAGLPERDPQALAGLLDAAVRGMLDALAGRAPGDTLPFYGGATVPVASGIAIMLGELVLHGHDIARSIGRPWPVDPRHASLVLAGSASVMPLYVDREAARGLSASYEIRLRGGERIVVRVRDGSVTVSSPGGAVDCRITADPVAFLLLGYGRIGQWGPVLTGKIVAWGRKPWLALKFASLLVSP